MAQTQRRMIYSKIWTSQQVGKLSPIARVLYVGMITLADDEGRLVGDSSYLRGQIFPYDDIAIIEVEEMRNQVEKMGLIKCYEVDDFEYIQHPNWSEYQVIRGDLYKPSTLPSCNGNVTKPLRKSTLSKDKLSKVKISKDNKYTDDFLSFWSLYPRKVGKGATWTSWKKKKDELPDIKILLEILKKQSEQEQWTKDNGQYIPNPATWLNQSRWEDEIITPEKLEIKTYK